MRPRPGRLRRRRRVHGGQLPDAVRAVPQGEDRGAGQGEGGEAQGGEGQEGEEGSGDDSSGFRRRSPRQLRGPHGAGRAGRGGAGVPRARCGRLAHRASRPRRRCARGRGRGGGQRGEEEDEGEGEEGEEDDGDPDADSAVPETDDDEADENIAPTQSPRVLPAKRKRRRSASRNPTHVAPEYSLGRGAS